MEEDEEEEVDSMEGGRTGCCWPGTGVGVGLGECWMRQGRKEREGKEGGGEEGSSLTASFAYVTPVHVYT